MADQTSIASAYQARPQQTYQSQNPYQQQQAAYTSKYPPIPGTNITPENEPYEGYYEWMMQSRRRLPESAYLAWSQQQQQPQQQQQQAAPTNQMVSSYQVTPYQQNPYFANMLALMMRMRGMR